MDYNRVLRYSVIESKYDVLKRVYANKDLSQLTEREETTAYINNFYSTRRAHDLPNCEDRGYMVYVDVIRQRNIYVTSKEVGLSSIFHTEMGINSLFHLISKSNNHEHYTDMTTQTKQWWVDNMQYVALQLIETEGNVVMFCNKGRTRSPMYLVAYLVIVNSMSVREAINHVTRLLDEQRGLELDRHQSLVPIIQRIYEVDDDSY